ncbi:MAG TPA: branched-chain amino acid ABC transporter permease [Ktedonobacteraceae bacterium]|nr:branched-chain amino acid ABC transporter permease [Ktedonobacteraceae bacterium]
MKHMRTVGLLALLIFACIFPIVFSNAAVTTMAVFTLLFAAAATGWNLFSGYTGYFSLGYATFYGLGAYTLALLCKYWHIPGGYMPFALLPLGGLVAAIFAVPLGWIALRVRRHTFVVVTIAMMFTFQLLAYNLKSITSGSTGMLLPFVTWSPDFFNVPFYYVALAILLLAFATSWWVRNSKYGLGLLAIRDDEDRVAGLGVKTGAYKLAAFVIAAFFAGMVGGMVVYFTGAIAPPVAFDPTFDVSVALMCIMGGVGTLIGPLVGALLLEPLQQYIILQAGSIGAGLDLFIFGALLLVVILFLPEGIIPSLRRLWHKLKAERTTTASVTRPEVRESSSALDALLGRQSEK